MMFPDPAIDSFVAELRAHYRAVGVADADIAADYYAAALEGMWRATSNNLPDAERFERVLEIHRRTDLTFDEKREQLSAAFTSRRPETH
jgi:hypothetical protein